MNIFKYILMAIVCIPIVVVLWMIGLLLIAVIGFPFVIKGCLEAIHSRVYE